MNANHSEIKLAVENLRKVSEALDSYANRPENYNSVYAQYLDDISWETFRYANNLEKMGVEFYV
jgi:hypothetical protein